MSEDEYNERRARFNRAWNTPSPGAVVFRDPAVAVLASVVAELEVIHRTCVEVGTKDEDVGAESCLNAVYRHLEAARKRAALEPGHGQ